MTVIQYFQNKTDWLKRDTVYIRDQCKETPAIVYMKVLQAVMFLLLGEISKTER